MLVADRKFRARFRHGRVTLIIGLTFLDHRPPRPVRGIVISGISWQPRLFADALLICGWAAMWEPITVLLYELWPILQRKQTYKKISEMEIDVLPLW